MTTPRKLLCLLILSAAILGPGTALADEVPTTSTDTAPLTLTQDQIDALSGNTDSGDSNKSTLEKASDFVTDNAPWFIIGIIVLAAIVAGILIMRGRPRKDKPAKAAKPPKGPKGAAKAGQPAQVPSASELRRRKRAAIQRSREEERMRRKAGIDSRKAGRRGGPAVPAVVAGAGAGAGVAAAAGALDPVEAEKQGARDQEVAAGAMARYGSGTVPAPFSPSQTAPAAGVVTGGPIEAPRVEPDPAFEQATPEPYVPAEAEPYTAEAEYVAAPEAYAAEPEQYPAIEPGPAPEAETGVIHEPSIESPGPDAAVGNAAEAFLAGGAAGAAGGFVASRAGHSEEPRPEPETALEPVIAPEPGLAPEHALAPDPVVESEAADDRLRAKVAELKASQEPIPAPPVELDAPAEGEEPEAAAASGAEVELSPGLAAVERRLSENSEERDRALREAEDRLRRVEQRAEDAERRAAFAERLAQLKVEESERERRLNDVVSGIDRAEKRALEAESRAEAAELAAAEALQHSDLDVPAPAEPVAPVDEEPAAPSDPAPSTPEPVSIPAQEAPAPPERKGLFGRRGSDAPADPDAINLNSATFEELREAGLSVTQATRILAYRERFGGYESVEDLEKVPGFPEDLIESLQGKLSI